MTQTLARPVETLTGEYQIDVAHSRVGFVARHAMVTKVRGHFAEFEGNAYLDETDPSNSRAEVRIKAESITTGNAQRDAHLRTNDFLDAQNYPEVVFKTTKVEPIDETTARVTGDLTIKDVTRPVTIDFEHTGAVRDPFGNIRLGFEGKASINRKDWGVNWNAALETGGFLVSDKIELEFDIAAVRVAESA